MTTNQEIEAMFNGLAAVEKWREQGPLKYWFRLKGIPIDIALALSIKGKGLTSFHFRLSHVIHTPTQIGPYYPGITWDDNLAYAVHRAVTAITAYYDDAVRKGHTPMAEWLVFNRFG